MIKKTKNFQKETYKIDFDLITDHKYLKFCCGVEEYGDVLDDDSIDEEIQDRTEFDNLKKPTRKQIITQIREQLKRQISNDVCFIMTLLETDQSDVVSALRFLKRDGYLPNLKEIKFKGRTGNKLILFFNPKV